ncbi:GNAT family N-acetyltransferase [Variovorax sp. EL159]|uniref:GNAT family N-acetyltransferase n=1 Tax=Variovorax sp. EL159 TaxID=1566270 RepID=UPI0008864501|nr:GNAT family N-acetyltransferase [Variovorax sp. EL159]SCX47182.1 Ribosomal protein S18 acetylase RimI [Variovorax sp. EL159]
MSNNTGTAAVLATNFTRDELTALWNRAYEGYFVPIAFDRPRFDRHLRRGDVDLALSRVIAVDGVACGISLAGLRQDRAYLAGFGIASTHRRQGLARQLIEAQTAAFSTARIDRAFLEVIEQNPARVLYRQAGFGELRTLDVLEWAFEARATGVGDTLASEELTAVRTACSAVSRPTWRRELSTVRDALTHEGAIALGVRRGAAVVGYAVMAPAGDAQGTLFDAAAIDEAAAHDLLDALAAARAGTRWRLVDEPARSPLSNAATARGASTVIRQIEMAWPFPSGNNASSLT